MSFTQAICAFCFELEYPGREPVRLLDAETETCALCGRMTTAGIYFRRDPSTVPFPRREDREDQ